MRSNNPEHIEQVTFFDWVRLNREYAPNQDVKNAMNLCYSNQAGAALKQKQDASGNWYSPEGKYLKAEGMTRGIPDVNLDYPAQGETYAYPESRCVAVDIFHGLRLEFKYRKPPISAKIQAKIDSSDYLTDLSPKQKIKRELLLAAGYQVKVVYSAKQAIREVFNYLPFEISDYQGVSEYL